MVVPMRSLRSWLRSLLAAAIIAAFLPACSNEECLDNQTSIPYIGFRDSLYPDKDVTIDSTAIYPIMGARHLPMLLDSTSSAFSITLPLDLESDTSTFVFEYSRRELLKAGIRDTLRLRYSRTPYFVSAACGVSYRILIEDATSTHFLIDRVELPDALVTNKAMRNINIYFRIEHPEETDPEETEEPNPEI